MSNGAKARTDDKRRGLVCPRAGCGCTRHRTRNSVLLSTGQVRRYRRCTACGRMFVTLETVTRY
jgi:transcriptional regulator NrdR family protein